MLLDRRKCNRTKLILAWLIAVPVQVVALTLFDLRRLGKVPQ